MWLSTPGTLGKNWGGRMRLCCVLSARISDSCFSGLRPGRSDINSFTWWSIISYFTTWACSQKELSSFCLVETLKHFVKTWISVGQGTSTIAVRLQRAGRRPPLTSLHLGWGDYWWHATIRGAPDRTSFSPGSEGPPPVYVLVGDSYVHLQR